MNLLKDIAFKNDLDSMKLSDTPAKLKLRNRTLNGINCNMARIEAANSIFSIPSADLAKKKKEVIEGSQEKENKEIEKEEEEKMINATAVLTSAEVSKSRQLKVSPEKFTNVSLNSTNFMRNASDITTSEIDGVIPEVEVPDFNAVQGAVGEVSEVIPIVDETVEQELPASDSKEEVNHESMLEESAMAEASAEEIFEETSKLKDEVKELQNKDKELSDNVISATEKFNNVANTNEELSKELAAKKQEKLEKKKAFFQVASKQRNMMIDYKDNLLKKQDEYGRQIEELNGKTQELEQDNSLREKDIENENNEISKYEGLIGAVSSFEFPTMELDDQKVYTKAA